MSSRRVCSRATVSFDSRQLTDRTSGSVVGVAKTRRSSHASARAVFLPALGDLPHALLGGLRRNPVIAKHILDAFGEFAFRFISKKVTLLITRCGLPKSEREDLYQRFALNLHARKAKFDPTVATWEGFVVVVCENQFVNILAHWFAEMRSSQREKYSLNDPVTDCDGRRRDRSCTIDERQHEKRTGQRFRSRQEAWEMSADVHAAMAGLTEFQRAICAKVSHVSVAAAARTGGVPLRGSQGDQRHPKTLRAGWPERFSVILSDNSGGGSVGH